MNDETVTPATEILVGLDTEDDEPQALEGLVEESLPEDEGDDEEVAPLT